MPAVIASASEHVDLEAQYKDKYAAGSSRILLSEASSPSKEVELSETPPVPATDGSSTARLSFWIIVNTLATIAIVRAPGISILWSRSIPRYIDKGLTIN